MCGKGKKKKLRKCGTKAARGERKKKKSRGLRTQKRRGGADESAVRCAMKDRITPGLKRKKGSASIT